MGKGSGGVISIAMEGTGAVSMYTDHCEVKV
jgi:hypothetical protein